MKKSKLQSYLINLIVAALIFTAVHLLFNAKVLSTTYRDLFTLICINAILAVSLNLSTGLLGELCLGHAGFMSVGAYTAALLTLRFFDASNPLSFALALLGGGLMAAVFGVVVGVPALRLRGDYLAITTLAFGEIIKVIVRSLPATGGGQPLTGLKLATTYTHSYWVLILTIYVIYALIRSRHGRNIISIREDDIASESCGVNTTRYKILAFALSAFFAGIAGGLYAHYQGMLEASMFDYNRSIDIMVMVVFGGIGSLTGSMISAVVITLLPELLRGFSAYRILIYSVLLIVLMLYRPSGLLGQSECSQQLFKDLFSFRKPKKQPASGVGGSSAVPAENLPVAGTPGRAADSLTSERSGVETGAPEEAIERKWEGRR